MENKSVIVNNNAKAFKRVLSFFIDYFFINILVAFGVQKLVFTKKNLESINNTIGEFKTLFGPVGVSDIKDQHIRFIVNSSVFDCFLYSLLLTFLFAILYNFLSYVFLNSSTVGQKLLSLRVVNMKNDEKPNKLKMLLKSILVQFPFMLIYIMVICQMLYLINFHLYAPMKNIGTIFMINMTKISNIYTIGIVLVFFFFFWFNIYYITDKLILSDIISRTRVVNSKIIDINNTNKKDITFYVDKMFDVVEKVNSTLMLWLKKWINYLKSKFKK